VRNLAQTIDSSAGALSCQYFLDQLVIDPAQEQQICATYNFSDVEDLKLFVNATWYRNNT
jgi:hypothetical protein